MSAKPPARDVPGLMRVDALDGWQNELTGIGVVGRDKTLGMDPRGILPVVVKLLSWAECEARWRSSDLGGRIVETVPNEMIREGWEIQIQPDEDAGEEDERGDAFPGQAPAILPPSPGLAPVPGVLPEGDDATPEMIEELEIAQRDLRVKQVFREALQFERAYGGGAILIGADDSGGPPPKPLRLDGEVANLLGTTRIDATDIRNLSNPLDETRIKRVSHLTAFQGGIDGELIAWRYYNNPAEANYGRPEVYMLRNLGVPISSPGVPGEIAPPQTPIAGPTGAMIFFVHESRLLVFPGMVASHRARVQMRGWGDSVFVRVDEVLSQYGQTWGGIANLMTDWAQGVLKVKGLADMIVANGTSSTGTLMTRLVGINLSKSIARTLLIDSEEEFKREVTPLSGLAEVVEQFALRLAAAADMPVTLLMGQAPAGLSATGASDVRFFYDRVAGKQEEHLLPALYRLFRLLMLSKTGPTKGKLPAKWSVQMRPLWQPTDVEEADVRLKIAQRDQIELVNGVVTPEEVAASRHGGSKWSMDTVIDLQGRKDAAALEEDRKAEAEKQHAEMVKKLAATPPPAPPPAPGANAGGGEKPSSAVAPKVAAPVEKPAPAKQDEWDETLHPRGWGGKFGEGEGGESKSAEGNGAGAGKPTAAAAT